MCTVRVAHAEVTTDLFLQNVGLGYIVGFDETAAANTGSVTRNHNCPT
jgi:hypothetical protein